MSRPPKNDPSELDIVFGALADPTRRAILELLRQHGPLPAGAVGERFPRMSRPAVSKHLRLLREAGLVQETHAGRSIVYRLSDAPVGAAADAWLEPFRRIWRAKLLDLKRFGETGEPVAGSGQVSGRQVEGHALELGNGVSNQRQSDGG